MEDGFIEVIIRPGQNFTDLAEEYYGDWRLYQRIVDANPNYARRREHEDLRYRPSVKAPVLFTGDKILVPIDPPQPQEEPQIIEEESIEDNPNEGELIGADDDWSGITTQTPDPMIKIFIPANYDPDSPDITYSADAANETLTKLLGYTFTEAVDDLHGSFSFVIENGELVSGKTAFDSIPLRSIVQIFEGGEKPAFVGMIRHRKLGLTMTQGVKRTITFSGKSLASCVTEYMVSLDVRIQGVMSAQNQTFNLTIELAKDNLTIMDFIKGTWNHFNIVSARINENFNNGVTNTEIKDIIKKFMCDGAEIEPDPDNYPNIKVPDSDKFVTVGGKETTIHYNIANSFYNQENNVIADMWKNILPEKVYEMYAYCGKDGKQKIMVRQVPFGDEEGNDDWKNLDIYLIRPVALTSYTLEQTDEEVYTVFVSYLIGSAMDRQFYMATHQNNADETMSGNRDKVNIYGFKPLQLDFRGYDRQCISGANETETLAGRFAALNKKAAYWYSRLDDMYSGNITLINNFNRPEVNPRVGCRARFMGGDFYIKKTEHSWQYGGTPFINLVLSRGMIYDNNSGIMKAGEEGIIPNVGKKYRELDREANH